MELRAIEKLAEDLRDLGLDDARAVVLDDDSMTVLGQLHELYAQIGQDAGFLGRVEAVVGCFLDGGEERPRRAVEPEEVPVLDEELADRDVALLLRHRLGGGAAARRRLGLGSGLRESRRLPGR